MCQIIHAAHTSLCHYNTKLLKVKPTFCKFKENISNGKPENFSPNFQNYMSNNFL